MKWKEDSYPNVWQRLMVQGAGGSQRRCLEEPGRHKMAYGVRWMVYSLRKSQPWLHEGGYHGGRRCVADLLEVQWRCLCITVVVRMCSGRCSLEVLGGCWCIMVLAEDSTMVTLGCSARNHGRKVV